MQRTLYIDQFAQQMVEQGIRELIIEGKIKRRYNVQDPYYMDTHSMQYYEGCVNNFVGSKEDLSGENFFREQSFFEKELENYISLSNQIMDFLSTETLPIKLNELRKQFDSDKRKCFRSPYMELEEQKAIETDIDKDFGWVVKKCISYKKWKDEIKNTQTKIIEILSNIKFASTEYLLNSTKCNSNRSKFFFIIDDLIAQHKIIETRKIDEISRHILDGYKLIPD